MTGTINIKELNIHITLSIGVASIHQSVNEIDRLLEHADRALYIAKHEGRNRVRIYS